MQKQARGLGTGLRCGVERVAEDRVAERLHVHPKLVGATGFRRQFDPRTVLDGVVAQHPVARERGFARLEIDDMQWPVGPIDVERQIDFTAALN